MSKVYVFKYTYVCGYVTSNNRVDDVLKYVDMAMVQVTHKARPNM